MEESKKAIITTLTAEIIRLRKQVEKDEFCVKELDEIFKRCKKAKYVSKEDLEKMRAYIADIHGQKATDYKKYTPQKLLDLYKEDKKDNKLHDRIKSRKERIEKYEEKLRGLNKEEITQEIKEKQENQENEVPPVPTFEKKTSSDEKSKMVEKAELFKKCIEERHEKYDKFNEIKKYRLTTGKMHARGTEFKKLREDIKKKDSYIKEFIHEFSMNKEYVVSPELSSLIGVREEKEDVRTGKFGSVLTRPTIKQHLKPIEDLEKVINDKTKSDEEKEKAKKEKEKREKRLGKKWLLKLKIDDLINQIKMLEDELKSGNISNVRKQEIEKLLSSKRSLLGKLEKEYGQVLSQIGNLIADIVIETEKNKKEKQEAKRPTAEVGGQQQKSEDENQQQKAEQRSTFTPIVNPNYVSPQASVPTSAGGYSAPMNDGSSIATNNTNLPEKKKKKTNIFQRILEKIKSAQEKKNEDKEKENKTDMEIVREEAKKDNFELQYLDFPNSKIEGKYFYHTVIKDDKVMYVKEPLSQINCSKKAILKEIKKVQKDWEKRDIEKEGPSGKKAKAKLREFLEKDSAQIYSDYMRGTLFDKEERSRRQEELMCGMLAANLPLESYYATQEGIYRDLLKKEVKATRGGLSNDYKDSQASKDARERVQQNLKRSQEAIKEARKRRDAAQKGRDD